MYTLISHLRAVTVIVILSSLTLPIVSSAQSLINLSEVPERLILPLPAGVNRFVTVTVVGPPVSSAWIATSRESLSRLYLSPTELGQYQINLADERLLKLLQSTDGRGGSFFVFAEGQDQGQEESTEGERQDRRAEVMLSAPIRYSLTRRELDRPKYRLISKRGAAQNVTPTSPSWLGAHWYHSSDEIDEIQARFKQPLEGRFIRIRVGRQEWSSAVSAAEVSLALSPEAKRSWSAHGTLVVQHIERGVEGEPLTLKISPSRLNLPQEGVNMTVSQRESRPVPKSHNFLYVHLGDITQGQVMVTLRDARSQVIVEPTSMRPDDKLIFRFKCCEYTLEIDRLVNRVLYDDYAVIKVKPRDP